MSCECVRCYECGGSGIVWRSFFGKYLGNRRCDDLDDFESCPECGGEGITEVCQEFQEAYEKEMEKEQQY